MWIALTCILSGFLASFLVAWGLAAFSSIPMYPRDTIRAFVANGHVHHAAEVHKVGLIDAWWGLDKDASQDPKGDADAILKQSRAPQPGRPSPRTTGERPRWGTLKDAAPGLPAIGSDTAFGWPVPCLWFQVTSVLSRNQAGNWQVDRDQLHGGLLIKGDVSSRGRSFRAFPLRPIPVGLAIDTIALGTPIWLLLLGLPWLRKTIRAHRGQCPKCGYNRSGVGTQSPCPECGLLE